MTVKIVMSEEAVAKFEAAKAKWEEALAAAQDARANEKLAKVAWEFAKAKAAKAKWELAVEKAKEELAKAEAEAVAKWELAEAEAEAVKSKIYRRYGDKDLCPKCSEYLYIDRIELEKSDFDGILRAEVYVECPEHGSILSEVFEWHDSGYWVERVDRQIIL